MNDREAEAGVSFPAALLTLLIELGELKRVRSAGRAGSIAERLFADGWQRLMAGEPIERAMDGHVGRALVAARLGDVDAPTLRDLGLEEASVRVVLRSAFEAAAQPIDPSLASHLLPVTRAQDAILPGFVGRLAAQPRAGVTCPGRPRLVFEPVENHAEHCATVALYGVLLSPHFGADPATVWLASLAHHLHNAFLPDSGWTGEVMLGPCLNRVVETATARCLAELPRPLASRVAAAREILADAATPEGRAFHASDTLDRVWQIGQHLRSGRLDLGEVLRDMALVHDGPVKPFQDMVLRAAGVVA